MGAAVLQLSVIGPSSALPHTEEMEPDEEDPMSVDDHLRVQPNKAPIITVSSAPSAPAPAPSRSVVVLRSSLSTGEKAGHGPPEFRIMYQEETTVRMSSVADTKGKRTPTRKGSRVGSHKIGLGGVCMVCGQWQAVPARRRNQGFG